MNLLCIKPERSSMTMGMPASSTSSMVESSSSNVCSIVYHHPHLYPAFMSRNHGFSQCLVIPLKGGDVQCLLHIIHGFNQLGIDPPFIGGAICAARWCSEINLPEIFDCTNALVQLNGLDIACCNDCYSCGRRGCWCSLRFGLNNAEFIQNGKGNDNNEGNQRNQGRTLPLFSWFFWSCCVLRAMITSGCRSQALV